jgi:hypothetical protein
MENLDKFIQIDFKLPKDFKCDEEFKKFILSTPYPTIRVFIPEQYSKEFFDLINESIKLWKN